MYKTSFQTPPEIAEYMCKMIPTGTITVLEPTPGEGNIVGKLSGYNVTAPNNFFNLNHNRYDCIVMNPPFSSKYAFDIPEHIKEPGMKLGYYILFKCMEMSDNVIALMPWFLILDSTVRLKKLKEYGLKSITALPRSTFQYARIQCCIIELQKGYKGDHHFKTFEFSINEK